MFPYFELLGNEEQQKKYEELLAKHAAACEASTSLLCKALEFMEVRQNKNSSRSPGIVLLQSRHLAEQLDAITVLVGKGCIEPCKQHLRGALEAALGILYLLETDSENRAIAYHIAEFHRRIHLYRKLDERDAIGIDLRKAIENDEISKKVLATVPQQNIQSSRRQLEDALERQPYATVEAEWQQTKKIMRREPPWYALYGGPKSIRRLAYHLNKAFWYELPYGEWSALTHAESALKQVAKSKNDPKGEKNAIKPLRHPDGLKAVCNFGYCFQREIVKKISNTYLGPVSQTLLNEQFLNEVKPRFDQIQNINIKAEWK